MVAGVLAAVLAGVDLRWLFVADACRAWRVPPCVVAAAGSSRPRRPAEGTQAVAGPPALLLLGLGTGFAAVYLQMTITLPLTVTARGLPVAVVGLLLTVSAVTVVLAQPLLAHPRWRRLDDPRRSRSGSWWSRRARADRPATSLAAYVVTAVVWSVGDVLMMGRA